MFDSNDPVASEVWAITAYFNPIGFQRRLSNYRQFRHHLRIPLLTVELAFGGGFELGDGDADILLQLQGHDVMWQKERLLNLALAALPARCTKVAWLDCDLIFTDPGWAEQTSAALERFAVVQPFSLVHRMPKHWRPGAPAVGADTMKSIGYALETHMSLEDCIHLNGEDAKCARGIAWAARRELLERHRLFDLGILGGGDALFFRSAFGYFAEAERRLCLRGKWADLFRAWAGPFHDDVRGSVGHIPGDVIHLWHGSLADRHYARRFEQFAAFGFDPCADIASDRNGAWRWNSSKPAMHAFVRDYFDGRREDG